MVTILNLLIHSLIYVITIGANFNDEISIFIFDRKTKSTVWVLNNNLIKLYIHLLQQ